MLIFTDGFDHTTTPTHKWTAASNVTIGATAARTGTNGAQLLSNAGLLQKQVVSADEHATFTVGMGLKRTSSSNQARVIFYSDSLATVHLTITINSNGSVSVHRGNVATLLGTSNAGDIPAATWGYLEIKAVLNDSTGSVQVRWNGADLLNLTGQDTKNAGTKTVFDGFGVQSLVSGVDTYVDDLYLTNGAGSSNTGLLGDVKIETLFPSGAGTTTQLTPSTGSNYTTVDETSPNTTDYNGSTTDNQYDTYAMGDLATASGVVYGVNVWAYAAKSDAGTKGGAIVVRSGGADYEQDDKALGMGYVYINKILEVDPATSSAWSISGVNAVEAGFKVKAS